jgi:transketolase
MEQKKINELKALATHIRRNVVEMVGSEGHTGHVGGSCSSADIVAALYGYKMKLDPKNPEMPGRDKFIYSKGHAAIAQYGVLAELGYFPKEDIYKTKSLGCHLQGHPDRLKTPGIEVGTGSLGQGLSIALGLALAMKIDKADNKVYCIMGDGELAEGQIWEAAMAAANYKVDNLIGIIDRNRLQATGPVAERMASEPIDEKWLAFGWNVVEIDGHDMEEIVKTLDQIDEVKDQPTVIIANTVKGKGISFAEDVVGFHNGAFTKEQYDLALGELDSVLTELEG